MDAAPDDRWQVEGILGPVDGNVITDITLTGYRVFLVPGTLQLGMLSSLCLDLLCWVSL
jgi:hypothetical protein